MAVCRRGTGRGWDRRACGGPAEPPPPAATGGRQDRQDRLCALALAASRGQAASEGQAAGVLGPAGANLDYRALLETYHDLRREHTAWVQRVHAVFFEGAPALARARAHRAGPGRAARGRRRAPVAARAAAGRHRPGHARRRRGPDGGAAHPARNGGPATDRREGAGRPAVWGRPGHRAGADLLAGRGRPVRLLSQGGPVQRAGRHREAGHADQAVHQRYNHVMVSDHLAAPNSWPAWVREAGRS